jgi:HlyD family secretion protein
MRRIVPIALGVLLLVLFVGTLLFLYSKSQADPVVYETETPFKATIIKKTVATGSLVPRREVEIKPRVSGVVDELFVEPGDPIKAGQDIARIKIIPNVVSLNQAEAAVDAARINFENARKEEARYQTLLKQNLISEVEFNRFQLEHRLRQQELHSATSNLQLVKSGAAKGGGAGKVSNVVSSTVDGMVIDVPVKEGTSVTETNNFNAGSTIALVADMGDMIFQGKVDESEVGKIKVGMPLEIVVGAIDKQKLEGKLEYIAPKGVEVEGAMQFEIKAAIIPDKDVFIRAGYSANADIVLDKRVDVLAVHEALLQFEKDGKPYVEVEVSSQRFEKRPVDVGVSDGVQIEVLKGVDLKTPIKKPPLAKEKPAEQKQG